MMADRLSRAFQGPRDDVEKLVELARQSARATLLSGTRYEIREANPDGHASFEPTAVAWISLAAWQDGREWAPVEPHFDVASGTKLWAREVVP